MSEETGKSASSNYIKFVTLINKHPFFFKELAKHIDGGDYDRLSKAMIAVTSVYGRTLPIIRSIILSEFEKNCRQPGSIMRSNCIASKVSGGYSRQIGQEYLKELIGPLVFAIVNDTSLSFEVDPNKLSRKLKEGQVLDEEVEKNQQRLLEETQKIFDSVTSKEAIDKMPREVRAIAYFTAEYARTYADDRISALVGGFYMLRIVNPSLLTPEAYGLLPSGLIPSPQARRSLTLVTKILQNLSNGVKFGSKEQYMVPMNEFIDKNAEAMEKFLMAVIEDPLTPSAPDETALDRQSETARPFDDLRNPPMKDVDPAQLQTKDLHDVHGFFYSKREKILETWYSDVTNKTREKSELDSEEQLFACLEALGEPPRTSKVVAKTSTNPDELAPITFLCQPHKTGELERADHAIAHRRFWFVLTDAFLYYFTKNADTQPYRCVPLDDANIQVPATIDDTFAFVLETTGKQHRLHGRTERETTDWFKAIRSAQRKYREMLSQREQLTALEVRMKNYVLGLKVAYHVTLVGQEIVGGKVRFSFSVQAFNTEWTVQKSYDDIAALHQQLAAAFPRLIFAVPPKVVEGQSSVATQLFQKGKQMSGVSSETSQVVNVKIDKDGSASDGLIFVVSFVRAFFKELSLNLAVSQSSEIFAFTQIADVFRATQNGNLQQLAWLLEQKGTNFNARNDSGRAPLHIAVLRRKVDVVRFLAEKAKVDINIADLGGNTPLHLAVYGAKGGSDNDDSDVKTESTLVKLLIDLGARVNAYNNSDQSALMLACEKGNKEAIRLLLTKNAKINAADKKGHSALHHAIQSGNEPIAEMLLESGGDASAVDREGNSLLMTALQRDMVGVAERLLKLALSDANKFDPNVPNSAHITPQHYAAQNGKITMIEMMVGNERVKFDVRDAHGFTPLLLAAKHGHLGCVQLLCRAYGTDLDACTKDGSTALHFACESGRADMAQVLIDGGASLNRKRDDERTPLHVATQNSHEECVRVLCKFSDVLDASLRDKKGRTALHTAAYQGNASLCELLAPLSGDVSTLYDKEGSTPLHLACWAKHLAVARVLVSGGADVNSTDKAQSQTPLHVAAKMGDGPLIQFLISKGADPSLRRDKDGYGAIHVAVANGHESAIKALAKGGANLNLSDAKKNTPLHVAASQNLERVALLLAANGAFLFVLNADSKSPLSYCKPNLRAALEEAAMRYAQRKQAQQQEKAAKEGKDAKGLLRAPTDLVRDLSLSPRGSGASASASGAASGATSPASAMSLSPRGSGGNLDAAAAKKKAPPLLPKKSAEAIQSLTVPTSDSGNDSATASSGGGGGGGSLKAHLHSEADAGASKVMRVALSAQSSMESLLQFLRDGFGLSADCSIRLAYTDEDDDEVILPKLDSDGFDELKSYARSLHIYT